MSEYLCSRYRPIAEELVKSHALDVPAATVDMLATTITNCRTLEPQPKKEKGKEPTPRERLEKARTHTRMLLKYTKRRPSHAESIKGWSEKLLAALDDFTPIVWLAIESPPIDVPWLIDWLKSGVRSKDELTKHKDELTRLASGLNSILSRKSKSTGRPTETLARIVSGGCVAWLNSGRTDTPYEKHWSGELSGPLPPFIRELLACCDGTDERVRRIERIRGRLTIEELRNRLKGIDLSERTNRDDKLVELAKTDGAEYDQRLTQVASLLGETEEDIDKDVQILKSLYQRSLLLLADEFVVESTSALPADIVSIIRQYKAAKRRYNDLTMTNDALYSALKAALPACKAAMEPRQ